MSCFFLRNNCVLFSQTSDAKRRSSSVSRTLHHLGMTPFEDTASPGAGNNPQAQRHPGERIRDCTLWVYPCGFTPMWVYGVIICYFWLGAPQKHPKTATQALRFGKWKANKPHQTPCSHIFASNHFPNNEESDLPRPIGTSTTRHLWAAYSWGCSNHSYGGFPTSGGPCLDPLVTPHCSPKHGHMAIGWPFRQEMLCPFNGCCETPNVTENHGIQRVESSTCSPKCSSYTQNIHNSPKQRKESTSMEDFNIPNGHWKTSKTKTCRTFGRMLEMLSCQKWR